METKDYLDTTRIRNGNLTNRAVPKTVLTGHLHYVVDIFSLTCKQFKITEQSTGESLKNFTLTKRCLVIADRAYGTIKSIESCLAVEGDFIIRIKNKAFNIYDADDRKLFFTDWQRTVGEIAEELNIYIRNSEKKLIPLRLCACKKTEAIGSMVCASARQNFDGDAVASSRNFNNAMVQSGRSITLISGRI